MGAVADVALLVAVFRVVGVRVAVARLVLRGFPVVLLAAAAGFSAVVLDALPAAPFALLVAVFRVVARGFAAAFDSGSVAPFVAASDAVLAALRRLVVDLVAEDFAVVLAACVSPVASVAEAFRGAADLPRPEVLRAPLLAMTRNPP
ncbi:hypothetical protein [Paracoccus sp. SCSIO 75233]|uniref:hypothetical protein n=1 Tax=Paracoccus sp. SCSIO 75233 TaxID=3017782 RepID=UPI0022F0C988|nr:hypothetical protein [Paracoccus sp. SCSIO 75233]WBU52082.1 hypothetical protein PAF12_09540 [Paracoccus sp. SCSIO 75233]